MHGGCGGERARTRSEGVKGNVYASLRGEFFRGELERKQRLRLRSAGQRLALGRCARLVLFPRTSHLISMRLTDKFGRAITDLRISVTDRCNYKCVYCRTGNEGALYAELPLAEYLRL